MPAIFRQFIDDGGSENEKVSTKDKTSSKIELNENLDSSNCGLTNKIAEKLLKKYGENCLVSQNNVSAMKIFAGQFKDFLVLVLLIAVIISIFMGEITEAIVILTILFLNAFMGFLQEFKTEKTLQALDKMISLNARVLRDGKLIQIPSTMLVVGDIVFLQGGDSVPADCVILESNCFEVDESMLTGESISVTKKATNFSGNLYELNLNRLSDSEKTSLVFMGTSVLKGTAKVKVVKTGVETQMGKISEMLDSSQKEQTPIQKKLAQMGAIIVFGCLLAAAAVVIIGILRGEKPFEILIVGLSLAVASIPEGLPAIVTIALAFAVKHMVKKKALVRKLHAVETLGCANVICTDKTGTITQNKMTVKKIVTVNQNFDVEGDGFSVQGRILKHGFSFDWKNSIVLSKLMENFVLCNNAQLILNDCGNEIKNAVGEPTELALLIVAAKLGVQKQHLINSKYEIYDEVPFDPAKKYMKMFVKLKTNATRKYVFVKGAYDVISKQCSECLQEDGTVVPFLKVKSKFEIKNTELAKNGMRVLSFAYGEISNETDLLANGLCFLGLVAMLDPPRTEAKKSVLMCKYAGIKTVMITGDQKLTAISIAKQVGIYNENDGCVVGEEIDKLTDNELKQLAKKTTIFARVSPEHKLRIVKALKRSGNVVAMTGDGVNDAPAIKAADIGVAMGKNGSDVAKQAADLVLLDDNFATLVCAIEEGRIIYANMRKFIRYLLSCNLGEVLTSFFAMVSGMPVPLLPMQILLINLVTDGLPAIALSLEPAEGEPMQELPRSIKQTIFSNGLVSKILIRGVLIALATLTVFSVVFKSTMSIELARTSTFLTLVSLQLIHVFECKSEKKSIFKINYWNNKKLLFAVSLSMGLALSSIWFAPVARLLKNYPLKLSQLLTVGFCTLIVPVISGLVMEIKNFFKRRKDRLIFSEILANYENKDKN